MQRKGFSLLEVTVVIFVMGITITALLQMFDFGYLRYNSISSGWQSRSCMTDLRVWLREKVAQASLEQINIENMHKTISFPDKYKLSEVTVSNYDAETIFIKLNLYEDRNSNNLTDKTELSWQRLFCFRRRNT